MFGPGQDMAEERPRAREGNRTLDLRITSASLCRLSYSGLHPRSVAGPLDSRLVVITPAGALELHRRPFKDDTSRRVGRDSTGVRGPVRVPRQPSIARATKRVFLAANSEEASRAVGQRVSRRYYGGPVL
jgi:hypothetical protein